MRRLLFTAALVAATLAPLPATAQEAAAAYTVSCAKDDVADVIVIGIKVKSGWKYACGNGANGGGMSVKDDVPFFVHDYTDTPEKRQWAFGTSEEPSEIWWGIHRLGEPFGVRLKMTRWR